MARPITWLVSPLAVLKGMQLVCALLAIIFLIDGRQQWWIYSSVFLLAFATAFFCVFSTILYYLDAPKHNKKLPWVNAEMLFDTLLMAAFLLMGAVMTWDWWQMRNGRWQHHDRLPPRNIGHDGWTGRAGALSLICLLEGFLFGLAFLRVIKSGIA